MTSRARAEVEGLVAEYGDVALSHFAQQVASLDPARRRALQRPSAQALKLRACRRDFRRSQRADAATADIGRPAQQALSALVVDASANTRMPLAVTSCRKGSSPRPETSSEVDLERGH